MRKSRLLLILIITILNFGALISRDELPETRKPIFYIGAYGDFNYNLHIADFDSLSGILDCCPHYSSGSGTGFALGGLVEIPLIEDLSLSVRLGFSTLNGQLSETERAGNSLFKNVSTGEPYVDTVMVEHIIDSRLYTAGIEPTINFSFFDRLTSQVGLRFAYMFTARMDLRERIVAPDNVVFLNESTTERNKQTDIEIPEKRAFQAAGVIGIGYELPLGTDFFLVPEVRFDIPFTDISNVTWKPATIQFGAYLKIPVYPKKEIPIVDSTVYVRDTTVVAVMGLNRENIKLADTRSENFLVTRRDMQVRRQVITEHYIREVPKTATLASSLVAAGIDREGRRQNNPTIVIEETEWVEGFPLLPQVFFKEGSSSLTEDGLKLRQKSNAGAFSLDSLPWNTLGIYSDLLNIVALRMKQNPRANLTITGCNSDFGVEKGNLKLSEDRANSVKNYLVDVWGIDPKRIIVKKQNLPANPSNPQIKDGQEENQRAELSSNDPDIFQPVDLREIVKTSNPPVVQIMPSVQAESGIKSWNLDVEQQGRQLRSYSGKDLPDSIIWNVEEKPLPQLETPVSINLAATDELGQKTVANKTLQIQQLTIKKKREVIKDDKRIEKYSLIVFNYDKAELTPQQKSILQDIKKRIQPNSKVTISGYADRTGTPDYNKDLAQRRIVETQKVLQVPEENIAMNSVGSDVLLYDNNSPQGRSYSRTVQIVVETPVK